ncbi:magnesium and cobalt efflux protein CorC [Vibrio ponticus]|nr:magnesium and cobalt efflux protein CorC [Vibrio ponticus]
MNEDNSPSSVEGKKEKSEGPSRKSFFERLGQLFQGEPKDRQELVDVIRDSEVNDLIDHDTRDMLEGVMEIAEMRVRDIMIPRSQMVTVERTDNLDALVALITDAQHSRYPVISEDKDHVEGILLAKDLLKYLGSNSSEFDIEQVIRPAVVVPESKRVDRYSKNSVKNATIWRSLWMNLVVYQVL